MPMAMAAGGWRTGQSQIEEAAFRSPRRRGDAHTLRGIPAPDRGNPGLSNAAGGGKLSCVPRHSHTQQRGIRHVALTQDHPPRHRRRGRHGHGALRRVRRRHRTPASAPRLTRRRASTSPRQHTTSYYAFMSGGFSGQVAVYGLAVRPAARRSSRSSRRTRRTGTATTRKRRRCWRPRGDHPVG